jgi:hypothetical protein
MRKLIFLMFLVPLLVSASKKEKIKSKVKGKGKIPTIKRTFTPTPTPSQNINNSFTFNQDTDLIQMNGNRTLRNNITGISNVTSGNNVNLWSNITLQSDNYLTSNYSESTTSESGWGSEDTSEYNNTTNLPNTGSSTDKRYHYMWILFGIMIVFILYFSCDCNKKTYINPNLDRDDGLENLNYREPEYQIEYDSRIYEQPVSNYANYDINNSINNSDSVNYEEIDSPITEV